MSFGQDIQCISGYSGGVTARFIRALHLQVIKLYGFIERPMAVGLTPRGKGQDAQEIFFLGVQPDRRETILKIFQYVDWLKVSMKGGKQSLPLFK